MDLGAGVKQVIVMMNHLSKNGTPKILEQCSLPLTGAGVADAIINGLAVLEVDKIGGVKLVELASEVSKAELREETGAAIVADAVA